MKFFFALVSLVDSLVDYFRICLGLSRARLAKIQLHSLSYSKSICKALLRAILCNYEKNVAIKIIRVDVLLSKHYIGLAQSYLNFLSHIRSIITCVRNTIKPALTSLRRR